jgi:hypothetical protein
MQNILQSKYDMFASKLFIFDKQTQYWVITYIQYNESIIWEANRNRPIGGNSIETEFSLHGKLL